MYSDPHVVPASKSETRLEGDPEALPLRRTGKEKSGTPAARGARSGGTSGASIVTVASSLLIVVGLFLLVAWGLRRAGPQRVRALPAEVVEVLGRTALGPRHFLQVVRFGNKLVLVSLTTGHAETLSEITDEEEVDRLMGLCAQKAKGSSSASFDQMLNSMNREQTGSVLLNHIREKLVRRAAQQNAGEVDNAV
jgi:flagellar biogenesis protein FliO